MVNYINFILKKNIFIMGVKIDKSWEKVLSKEFNKEYFKKFTDFIRNEYMIGKIYPPPKKIFNAFDLCAFDILKVVILGQDPYHGAGQANGLCFSVNPGISLPPSLQNIYKELKKDLGVENGSNGDLSGWAKQGVLLLNATLTVKANQAGSHQGKGWEEFTDSVIKVVSAKKEHIVFILWGAYARKKVPMIDPIKHFIVQSVHPSPFSADSGFFGSRPFSQTNEWLKEKGLPPVDWKL